MGIFHETISDGPTVMYILGAEDPEMAEIRKLLTFVGARFGHATVGGVRVTPGNAYKADGHDGSHQLDCGTKVVFVECRFATGYDSLDVHIIDHHNLGDPGYDAGPNYFLAGSSIGQVIKKLILDRDGLEGLFSEETFLFGEAYSLGFCRDDQNHYFKYGRHAWRIPDYIVLVAACDHCLGHAYRGLCPVVAPSDVYKFRVAQIALHTGKSPDEIDSNIKATAEVLCTRRGPIIDMTDRFYEQLPDAACKLGLAYEAAVVDRDGKSKLVYGGYGPPSLCITWMQGKQAAGYTVYGSPERGYAGASR